MKRRGLLLFALLSVLWGIPYLMIKVAITEVSVPFLVFARSAVGAIALLPIAFAQRGFDRLAARWFAVLCFCLIEMVIPWGLIAHGEEDIASSTAGLLIALTPIATLVLAKLTGSGEPIGVPRALGLFLGFSGVFVLAAPSAGGGLLAIGEIVLAAICYGIGSIIAARWLNDVPAAVLTTTCLLLVALIYAIPAAQSWPTEIPSTAALGAVVSLGVFCTALAFTAFFYLVRDVGPERAVVITYVAPAVAVIAGVIVLDEPLDGRIIAAFALILGGSYLATGRAQPKPDLELSTRLTTHEPLKERTNV